MIGPVRNMPDDSPCWCVSSDEPHEGWVHSPLCDARREAIADREIYACAVMVDSTAAQILMLSEDGCLTDDERDELADLGQACRRVAEDLHVKAGLRVPTMEVPGG